MGYHVMAFVRPAALAKIERILALLAERPRHVHDLAEAVPLSKRYAQIYLNHLMAQEQVHIKRWVRNIDQAERMYPRPVYAAGKGVNAPAPKPLTKDQRKKRAWARVKADPERHTKHLMKKRVYRAVRRAPRPDIAAAWLYGAAA